MVEARIPVIGQAISMIFRHYPEPIGLLLLKWAAVVGSILLGLLVGKQLIHHKFLRDGLGLKMFSKEKGTWMVMFFSTILFVAVMGEVWNFLLSSMSSRFEEWQVDSYLGISNETFMKIAASGTWVGDYLTAYMVRTLLTLCSLFFLLLPFSASALALLSLSHTNSHNLFSPLPLPVPKHNKNRLSI